MTEAVYGVVYCLTSPSGKQYVGQTIQPLNSRMATHKSAAKRLPEILLYRAFAKYGFDKIERKIIDTAYNLEELNTKETYWIRKLNTMSPAGYNTREVSLENFSEYVRNKISAKKMGHEVSKDTRKKISDSLNKRFVEAGGIQHGTHTGYSYHKCRCQLCKDARSIYRKDFWKKNKR